MHRKGWGSVRATHTRCSLWRGRRWALEHVMWLRTQGKDLARLQEYTNLVVLVRTVVVSPTGCQSCWEYSGRRHPGVMLQWRAEEQEVTVRAGDKQVLQLDRQIFLLRWALGRYGEKPYYSGKWMRKSKMSQLCPPSNTKLWRASTNAMPDTHERLNVHCRHCVVTRVGQDLSYVQFMLCLAHGAWHLPLKWLN